MGGKVPTMANAASSERIGRTARSAARGRARRSPDYRAARDEYDRIRVLRETNPIAAHLRERRYELGLTQAEVAAAAKTSHSAISRLEKGTFLPRLPTLQRIAFVLDEELLVCFRHVDGNEVEERYAKIEPALAGAR